MSAEVLFGDALNTVKAQTRALVTAALGSINRYFAQEAGGFARKYRATSVMTHGDAARMASDLKKILAAIGVHVASIVIAEIDTTISDSVDAIKGVHEQAANDADVEVDGLDDRFTPLYDQTFDRISKTKHRALVLPALINAYVLEAERASQAFLDRAVAAGVSQVQTASDIAILLTGGDISYGRYSISRVTTTPLRGLDTSVIQIAMSEALNTMREVSAAALDAGGFVEAAPWLLSPAHQVTDVCDDIAAGDGGFPKPGYYAVKYWPLAPHPRCACFMGAPFLFFPTAQW